MPAVDRPVRRLYRSGFFLIYLIIALATMVLTSGAAPALDMSDPNNSANLALNMQALKAPQGNIQQLTRALDADEWKPVQENPQLLCTSPHPSTLWLKADLSNPTQQPLRRWLELSPWRLAKVDAWLLTQDTQELLDRIRVDLDTPVSERRVESTRPVIPIRLSPGQSLTLVLRIDTDTPRQLAITSWDPVAFAEEESDRYQLHSILLTIILTLFAVLLLQFNLRYLLVGLWMLALFTLQAEKEGYITYLFFQTMSDYSINLRFSSSIIEKALFLIVSVYLLGLKDHRQCRWIVPFAVATAVISTVVGLALNGNELRQVASVIHIALIVAWLPLIPVAAKQKARFQCPLIGILAISWVISTIFVLSFAFGIHYPPGLVPFRTVVQILVILGLLLVYTRQKHDYEKSLENQLRRKERAEREQLEQAVFERTQRLNEALESARQANDAKTSLLERVTHDLKSPLTSILGYAQLLRAEQGRTGRMSYIIYNSAHHMLNMVTRLIDYARDVTTEQVTVSNVYLHTFLENVEHESRILAKGNGNRFHMELDPALHPVIQCDETFLREILLNLIGNAAKYTKNGDITLRVSNYEDSTSGKMKLVCSVEDTGCGITPEQQNQLFTPFYQAACETEGVGLGLSIVKELVDKIGGEVVISSEPQKGTRVDLTLPVEPGQEAADTAFIETPNHILPQFDASGLTAWVVEDSPAIIKLLHLELETLGFDVELFHTAEEAEAALADTHCLPDLIITDHRLPGNNGDAVLRAAKGKDQRLPVILVSATRNLRSTEAGSAKDDYTIRLGKPVDLVRMRREIARVCLLDTDPANKSGPHNGQNTQKKEVEFDQQTLDQLHHWCTLGAVTDIIEWCDALEDQFPEQTPLARELRELAERGDFNSINDRIAALRNS
ncbi:MAG: ATP-binding protein [Pseudomonadota bacterium]